MPEFGTLDKLPMLNDNWYSTDGRARLVIVLKRTTHDLIQAIRYDLDMHGMKFRVKLYQWLEGDSPNSKLPKMRDIVDSNRDFIDG